MGIARLTDVSQFATSPADWAEVAAGAGAASAADLISPLCPRRAQIETGVDLLLAILWGSVIFDKLDLKPAGLLQKRGVHASVVSPVRWPAGFHAGVDKGLVRAVDVIGSKAEVAEMGFGVTRSA